MGCASTSHWAESSSRIGGTRGSASSEPRYVSFVSLNRCARISNSVGTFGDGSIGRPQFGFPRLRMNGFAATTDDTPIHPPMA